MELKTQNGLNSRQGIAKKISELEYLSKNIQTDIRRAEQKRKKNICICKICTRQEKKKVTMPAEKEPEK